MVSKLRNKKIRNLFLVVLVIFILGVTSIQVGKSKLKKMINSLDYSQVIYNRDKKIIRVYLNGDEQFIFPMRNKEVIPEKLKIAVLQFEDKNFYSHLGVDIKSLFRAIYLNVTGGRVISGGSTITMQTIRLLRGGERTYINKVIEMFYAVILESFFTKDEILNLYLSNAPYGGNIRGYQGAIYKYFREDSLNLTWSEAATLAILPNAPSAMNSIKEREKFIKKRNRLLKTLYAQKFISEEEYQLSILEILPKRLRKQDEKNVLFSNFIRSQTKEKTIITTLDPKIQNTIEEVIAIKKRSLERNNIFNTGILVVDTKTREILGYYGGDNTNNNYGKIDALRRKRNVGSTLKPFLYSLSMDKGILTKNSKLVDIPTYFTSFSPTNSDKKYRGLIRADKALQMSLNIPMVRLLEEYGVEHFYNFFIDTKLVEKNTNNDYGLTMILGTFEMTPLELTALYTSLGNLGDFQPLVYTLKGEDNKKLKKNQLISKGASYLTLDILKNLKRPNQNWELYKNQNTFYWKTGTSYGEKDGWAVGVNKNYTILVWNGNLDNTSGTKLNGLNISAPIMFDILYKINYNQERDFIDKPSKHLKKVEVTKNGFKSSYNVVGEKIEVPKEAIIKIDPYEKKVFVDKNTGKIIDSRYWGDKEIIEKIIFDYGEKINYFLEQSGSLTFSERNDDLRKKELTIIYPQNNMKIQPIKNSNNSDKKVRVLLAGDKEITYYDWYVNNKFVKRGYSNEEFLELSEGVNLLLVVSDDGRSGKVIFKVK